MDIVYLGLIAVFLLASWAFVAGCAALEGRP